MFFRAIKPKRLIGVNVSRFVSEVNNELRSFSKDVETEMAKPTRQWSARPDFQTEIAGGSSRIVMITHPVGAQAEKYERIDFGTPARVIRPRKANGFLRFQPGYTASTIPNRLWSRMARRRGAFVYARIVHYPGIKARNFSKQVRDNMRLEFRRRMENLIRREVRKGGGPV